MSDFMILISLLNKKEINYQPIFIDSLSSKWNLLISSANGITGNLLFLLTVITAISEYLVQLPGFSLESTFTINPAEIMYCSMKIFTLTLFHIRFTQRFLDEVFVCYRAIDIDYDYQTRKYYWTRRAVYRILIIVSYIPRIYCTIIIYKYYWFYDSNSQSLKLSIFSKKSNDDLVHYWAAFLAVSISFPLAIFQDLVFIDLAILTQSALYYINNQLTLIRAEMNIDGAKLDYKVIKTLRWQYLLVHRLVDKLSSLMNLCTFLLISKYVTILIFYIYIIAFDHLILVIKMLAIGNIIGTLIGLYLITHSIVSIYTKSQEFSPTLNKISLQTESFRTLNEISLFLYRIGFNDVGFSFGGIFMITPDFISTLAAVTITVIIAIPSFLAQSC